MNDLRIDIPITDIPQSVMDSVRNELKHFLVPMLGEAVPSPSQGQIPDLTFIGSGTLVWIDGAHYVLTAAHVWGEAKKYKKVHFVLTDRAPSAFAIPWDHIPAKTLWDQQASDEWGPDIALLEIARPYVSTIEAHKSFLNLSRQKATLAECPPKIEKGYWAIMGMVEEFSRIQRRPEIRTGTANANYRTFFSTIQQAQERQGYDYLDVGAKQELFGVPSTFGGVSGGGLWQIDLLQDESGVISWNGKRHFRGVAFWQSNISDGRRVIRCHGPRSIFEMAWAAWELPRGV